MSTDQTKINSYRQVETSVVLELLESLWLFRVIIVLESA